MSTPVAEPVPVMVKRWECPFCRRRRSGKAATAEHLGRCWLNPAVRSCKTCALFLLVPSGEPCFPGRPCNCNDGYVECRAGESLSFEDVPRVGCPLWELRPAERAA